MTKRSAKPNQGPSGPNFKPRNSGAIKRVGTIVPKEPPANKPAREGVRKSLYINK